LHVLFAQSAVENLTFGVDMIEVIGFDDPPAHHHSDRTSHEHGGSALQGATAAEVADYVADMLQDLREISSSSGHAPLDMLLELAQREARRVALMATNVNQSMKPPLAR
jgi:hypothetical protein